MCYTYISCVSCVCVCVCRCVSFSVLNINYYSTGWMAEESDFDSRQANVISLLMFL